jgi:hypothetical protein
MDDYSKQERIAIKQDSRIPEYLAIKQTDAELKAKELPDCVAKAELLRQKMRDDHADKQLKKQRRIYE